MSDGAVHSSLWVLGPCVPIFARTTWPFAVGAEIISSPPLPDHTRQICLLQCCCAGIQLVRTLLRNPGRKADYSILLFPLLLLRTDSLPDCLAREQRCLIRCFALMCRAQPWVSVQEEALGAAACCECKSVSAAEICTHAHTPLPLKSAEDIWTLLLSLPSFPFWDQHSGIIRFRF